MLQNQDKIYIVLTQTGTYLSRLLSIITGAQFNHASISMTPDLQIMYSFGRRNPSNPFWAGYVVEQPQRGIYERFPDTKAMILEVDVTQEQREKIYARCEEMLPQKERYRYNFLGLCFAAFKIVLKRKNYYYCSEFIKEELENCNVVDKGYFQQIVQPMHFVDLPGAREIYCGKLNDYSYNEIN